jgi:hypothetical protein
MQEFNKASIITITGHSKELEKIILKFICRSKGLKIARVRLGAMAHAHNSAYLGGEIRRIAKARSQQRSWAWRDMPVLPPMLEA